MGGGSTLSATAGRGEILELLAEGRVAFGGTFNGNPLSLAAALVTLDEIFKDGGRLLKHANDVGQRLMQALTDAAAEAGVPLSVTGFGSAFSLHFGSNPAPRDYRDYLRDDRKLLRRFLHAMLDRGIYSLPDGRFYVSAAHGEAEIEQTVRAARSVFHSREWKAGHNELTNGQR